MEFNLADIFESIVDVIPDHTAVVCNRSVTYRELDERTNQLASVWKSQGIGPGDHVGLLLYNSTEFVEAMIAALKLRAVPVNLNYRYVAHELVYMFDNANLVGLLYERELGGIVADALAQSRPMKSLIAVGEGEALLDGAENFEDAVGRGSTARFAMDRSEEDILIMYTGGTTGMPRGVMWRLCMRLSQIGRAAVVSWISCRPTRNTAMRCAACRSRPPMVMPKSATTRSGPR